MAKNPALKILGAKSADFENHLNHLTSDEQFQELYTTAEQIPEDQEYKYEENIKILEKYMIERGLLEKKEEEPTPEPQQQSAIQRGGRIFAETKRKLAAGEKVELSDDDLQILKSFLEQMHENGTLDEIANADIIKFVAEKLPENQEQNEADDIQKPAIEVQEQEEKPTASTAETQAPEPAAAIKEAERKVRTPQELLDIAMGPNRLQSIEDAMTTQELISLHKHIGNLRPKRDVKLSKKEANDLHIRSSIDRIVLHTLGVKLITPPYQELKDIEKSGEQFLLRDVFRHYQQEDKSNELQVEKALEALNDERHKRGLENLEYRFEYLGMPKNKRPDYHQFLFDKFYEMPTEEVLESIGISNLYTLRKNMGKYLASHEADDNKKTFLNLQINQAINSHRDAKKQEKKRRQQEENLPMIKTVYDEIKGYALVDNITEIHNVLQRLQPAQLELVEQMEQYADEQAKNETNEELKAKLENIDGYVLARISELREELRSVQADSKSTAQESSAKATSASEQPETVQVEEKEELKSEAEAEAKVAENEELKSEAEAESEQTSTSENEQENEPKIGRFDAEFIENWQKKREDAEEDLRLRTLHGITSLKQSMDTLGDELDSDTRSTLNEALDNKFSENFKNQENGEKGEYYKILLEWATSPEAYKVEDFRNCIEAFYPNGTVKNGPEGAELDNLMQEISKYRQEHNMEPISFGHEVNGKNYDTPANKSETVTDETTAMPSETIEHEKSTIEQKQESEVTPKSVEEEEKQQPQSEEDRIKALYNHIAEVGWHEIPYEEQLAISNRDLLMLVKYAKIQKENARGAENYDSISSTYIDLYMQGIIRLEKSDYENNQFVTLGSSGKEEDLLFLKDYIDTVFEIYPTGKNNDEYLAFVNAVNKKRAEKGLSTSLEDEFNKLDRVNDQESVVQNAEPATQEAEPIAEIETEPQVQPNIEQENTAGGTIIIGPASPDTPIAEPVPESEPIIIGGSEPEPEPEPENRADLYTIIDIENVLELTKEEPETIKEVLQRAPLNAITDMYQIVQYNIDQGHVTAGDENLAKFYEVATNHILETIKNDTRSTDEFSPDEIRERAELLQTYAQDFAGNDIAFADSHDTDFYRFQLDIFTQSAQDENDGNTENSLNNDGAGTIIIDNSNENEDDNENSLNNDGAGTIIIDNSNENEDDNENAYEILESAAKSGMLPMDVFDENDGAIHYYEDVVENQNRKVRNSRIERLNNFFDNVELEHDEEWRRFASSIVGNKIIGGKGNYQVEDLKAEMREIAEQRAILEVIEENRTAGISVNDMSDLQGNMADKVLDQMEFLTAQLVSAQMVKETYAEMTKDIELKTDDKGNLTKESQMALRDKMMSTIEEIGNADTGGFWERMKNRVQRFMEPEDDEDYERTSPKSRKYIISDSVAINLNQQNKERLEKDINDSKADKGSQTSTLLHKLRERHENMKKKFAKTYPALSAAYSGVKGFALVGAVAKYAPGVLPYYIGYNVCKAWYGVHKGYTKYKQRGGQGGFGSYWRNNKIQVTATVASTALTMLGLKEEKAYAAIATGLASAAPEFAHGRWKVGLVKLATTAYGAYLGLGDKFSSNENVNDNDLQNMLKQQELMDKEVEQQKATFNIYRPAENLSQDTSQSTDTIEDQQSTSNDNNNQHHAPVKHTTPTVNNDDEIARVKEAVKFTAPEIERDAPGDDLASSGSAIGDFTLPEYVEQPPHPPALSNAETLFVNDQAMGDVTLKQAENGFSIHYSNEIEGRNHTEMMIEQNGVKHCVIQQEDGSMRYMTPAEEEKFMYSVNRICTECNNDIAYDKDLLNHIHNSPTVQSQEEAAFYEREEFQELARAKDIIASAEDVAANDGTKETALANGEAKDGDTQKNDDVTRKVHQHYSERSSVTFGGDGIDVNTGYTPSTYADLGLPDPSSDGLQNILIHGIDQQNNSVVAMHSNGYSGVDIDPTTKAVTSWTITYEDGKCIGLVHDANGGVRPMSGEEYTNNMLSARRLDLSGHSNWETLREDLQTKLDNAPKNFNIMSDNEGVSQEIMKEQDEAQANADGANIAAVEEYSPAADGLKGQIIETDGHLNMYKNGFEGIDIDDNGNKVIWTISLHDGKAVCHFHTSEGTVEYGPKDPHFKSVLSSITDSHFNSPNDSLHYEDAHNLIEQMGKAAEDDKQISELTQQMTEANIQNNTGTGLFIMGRDIDLTTKQPVDYIVSQNDTGFSGRDTDANGNEVRSWMISLDDRGLRHCSVTDANGTHEMSDDEFNKCMLRAFDLRSADDGSHHVHELINKIYDAELVGTKLTADIPMSEIVQDLQLHQAESTNLQYSENTVFMPTGADGKDGVLFVIEDDKAHCYETVNGVTKEADLARVLELEKDVLAQTRHIMNDGTKIDIENVISKCEIQKAVASPENFATYATSLAETENLHPQKTFVADDMSHASTVSGYSLMTVDKEGHLMYAKYDPTQEGNLWISDGTTRYAPQSPQAQQFFAENKELFVKAGLQNTDFAKAAYGEEFSATASNTGIDNDKLTKNDNPQGDNNDTRDTRNTHGKGSLRASLDAMKARGSSMDSGTGNSYDDFIKGIQEDAYINSRPFNAEELEQKYGLVRPAAVLEEERATRTELAGTVTTSRGVYSFTHAENGFAITSTSATRVMVYNETTQEAHFLIANEGETPHEMNKDEVRSFLDNLQKSIEAEAITNPENFVKDKGMYLNITHAYFDQHPELTDSNSNNTGTATNTVTNVEQPVSTDGVDLSHLHIMAATERATEFGLTGGDTRSVETGQYKGTVVTKAENGWQIRYPEGNSIILKAENGTLSGMFIDADDKVTNMKPQEVEQYRQAAADAYKNSRTTYGETSANMGIRAGGINKGNSYA